MVQSKLYEINAERRNDNRKVYAMPDNVEFV